MRSFAALAVALAATAVYAAPEPARIEARASASGTGSSTLPTVTTQGNAFYVGSERFYIKGIDYQPGGSSGSSDPLADATTCKRDIQYFKQLGLNTIRVYTVDNSVNHDECMTALAEAGIYLVLDVNTPLYSLDRSKPAASYNPYYLQSVFATIDAFATYSNTLCFFSGNEVINAPNTVNTAPYIKAVTRDMKQYIGERGYRAIPVGYSAADVAENQYLMAQYMDCGDEPSRSDFYAINNYEWCDPSSFTESGWDTLVAQYSNYSLPVFMSEYGCVSPNESRRTFAETTALYQPDMTGVFSGGLVYEYSQEGNNYGIVTISGNTVTPYASQFSDLQNALSKVTNPSGNGGAHGSTAPQQCPGQSTNWDTKPFTGSALPATPSGAQQLFRNGAGKGPGLDGKGSQWQVGGSSATASSNAGSVTQTYGSGSGSSGSSGSSSSASGAADSLMRGGNTELLPIMICGVAVALSFGLGAALF